MEILTRLKNYFCGDCLEGVGHYNASRINLTFYILAYAFVFLFIYNVISVVLGVYTSLLIDVPANVMYLLLAFYLKKSRSYWATGVLLSSIFFIQLTVQNIFFGSYLYLTVNWYLILIAYAFLTLNKKTGAVFTILSILVILYVSLFGGQFNSNSLPGLPDYGQRIPIPLNYLLSFSFLYVIITVYRESHLKGEHQLLDSFSKQARLNEELKNSEQSLKKNYHKLKRIQKDLVKSEKNYRFLSENARDMISLHNAGDGVFKYVSPSCFELLGYEPDELLGKNSYDFFYPDDRDAIKDSHDKAIRGDHDNQVQYRMLKKDGSIVWYESITRPIFDESGHVVDLQCATREIGERKRLELLLEESQSMAKVGGWEWNLVEDSMYWTSEMHKIFETGRDFIPGMNKVLSFLGRKDQVILLHNLEQVFETGEHLDMEVKINTAENNDKWLRIIGKSVEVNRASQKLIGAVQDISSIKQYERQIVREKEKAEKATAAKHEFLSTMTHELRTPMNAVIGMTEVLLDDDPRPDQLENLEVLRFSSGNLLKLINDILDVSKIEARRISLEQIEFNINDLLGSIYQSMITDAEKKDIRLKIDVDDRIPARLTGDSTRLNQILLNLLSNAIKFTHEGHVILKLYVRKMRKREVDLRFEVRDTGIGIERKKIKSILESFTQADDRISRIYGGTGLGLSIVEGLLELFESNLHIESEPGKGSVFSFDLTMNRSIKKYSPVDVESHGHSNLELDDQHILLVEDNEMNQVVVRKYLQKYPVKLEVAENGNRALDLFRKQKFDMVLLDLNLPDIDGYTVARKMHSLESEEEHPTPIIAVTASNPKDVLGHLTGTGIKHIIIKPFKPEEIITAIAKHNTGSVSRISNKK